MNRLFTLILAAFVFAFTAPLAMHNASAQDNAPGNNAATTATDNAMQGDHAGAKEEMHRHHGHPAAANEANKTNGMKHTHAHHHHKHMHHHKKAEKGAVNGADEGAAGTSK